MVLKLKRSKKKYFANVTLIVHLLITWWYFDWIFFFYCYFYYYCDRKKWNKIEIENGRNFFDYIIWEPVKIKILIRLKYDFFVLQKKNIDRKNEYTCKGCFYVIKSILVWFVLIDVIVCERKKLFPLIFFFGSNTRVYWERKKEIINI